MNTRAAGPEFPGHGYRLQDHARQHLIELWGGGKKKGGGPKSPPGGFHTVHPLHRLSLAGPVETLQAPPVRRAVFRSTYRAATAPVVKLNCACVVWPPRTRMSCVCTWPFSSASRV